MRLHDALFNWLQMAIVVEGRPDDRLAHDTLNFFAEILAEDHQVDRVEIIKKDDTMIHVRYGNAEGTKVQAFLTARRRNSCFMRSMRIRIETQVIILKQGNRCAIWQNYNATAPVSRSSRHRRKSRGKKKVIILSILFIILGAVFIYAAIIADKYNNLMDQISAQDPEDGVTDAVYGDNSSVKLPKADSDVTTILLLGTDNRPRLGSLNTDVIMLVSLRPDPRSAVIVSMPRDTYMDPTGWKAGKANGFYAKARSVNKDKAYTYVRAFGILRCAD